jgi:toxin ParE1/3/4
MSVRFTALSSRQIDKALSYIRERSPSGAEKVSRRISEAIDLLGHPPRSGRETTKSSTRRLNLALYPYVIFYRVIGDDVVVTRFVHSARRSA